MVLLSNAGVQLPVIPLLEVFGKAASGSPAHIGATAVKAGVCAVLTVMVIVLVAAHWPASGVKV